MRRFISWCFLVMLCSSADASEKIKFSGGAPLDTHQPAVIVPLLKEAFRRNGIAFEAIYLPSNRSLVTSNSGKTDGELHRIYEFHKVSGNRYPNLIRIESKLMAVHRAYFAIKNLAVKTVDDLKGLKIAYQAGRKNVEKLLARFPKNQVYPFETDHRAFTILARNRIDIVVAESFLGRILIAQEPKFKTIKELLKIDETPIYAYIHKKHQRLAIRIATTLDAMKKDGTFKSITSAAERKLLQEF